MTIAIDYGQMRDTVKDIEIVGGTDPIAEANELYKAAESAEQLDEFISRRIVSSEPVAYITGKCFFAGFSFYIFRRALIPRVETETLLDAGMELPLNSRVADIGTGSGAVAISLKKKRPDLSITGIDISKDALDLACINVDLHNINVDLRHGNLLAGMKKDFDAVLANLPYLPTDTRDEFSAEMTENEPEVALWGGPDGLNLIRSLLKELTRRPSVKVVALEHRAGQADAVMALVREFAFPVVFGITDKKADIRCTVGKRG